MEDDDSRPELIYVVNHAIYSTYLDLRALGQEREAHLLLQGERPER